MNCLVELRGLGAINDDLADLGVRLFAVSADPPEQSRPVVQRARLPFPILADEDLTLTRALGVLHPGGGPRGSDIPLPALVLIGKDCRIYWKHAADRVHNRLSAQQVLERVRAGLAAEPL